jgi:hypothetical protein
LGSFDVAIIASAILAGAREFVTFDERLAALATALGIKVHPELTSEGRGLLAKLRA